MSQGFFSRFLIAVFLIISLPGCVLQEIRNAEMDASYNQWIGKTKDERMKRIGPPEQCAKLSDGGEVCDWVLRGVSNESVKCPPDFVHGGHQCSGGGGTTWEHHIIFTYDRAGIAQEWSYQGSEGQRSSRDSQSKAGLADAKTKKLSEPTSTKARRSPSEIPYIGVSLDASRQQIHEIIVNKGGRLLTRLQSPERDEYDSSTWIEGSSKVSILYTKTGKLVSLGVVWSVADQQEGVNLAASLRTKITKDFGAPTRDDRNAGSLSLWETTPVTAGVFAGETAPYIIIAGFGVPQHETILNAEGYTSRGTF